MSALRHSLNCDLQSISKLWRVCSKLRMHSIQRHALPEGVVLQPSVGRNFSSALRPKLSWTSTQPARQRRGSATNAASQRQTVVPQPSYAIPSVLGGLAVGSALAGGRVLPFLEAVLAAFLAFQASRVRFRFEADALEVVIGEKESKSENKFVGGENRWKYDTFTNWEFWWPNFPVLVYFKETQTKPEGQIHFFPVIFDGKQVYDVMVERCGKSQNSAPSA